MEVMLSSCARAGALLSDGAARERVSFLAEREAALCGKFEQVSVWVHAHAWMDGWVGGFDA